MPDEQLDKVAAQVQQQGDDLEQRLAALDRRMAELENLYACIKDFREKSED